MERSVRCTMCGTAPWEWEENAFGYETVFVTCRGCQLKEEQAKDDTPKPSGTTIRLMPAEEAEKMRRRLAENPPQRPRLKR